MIEYLKNIKDKPLVVIFFDVYYFFIRMSRNFVTSKN